MSRIELHCPSCGYDVPMTLLPPPKMFECPECQEVIPRDKLTRLKVLHRHIAGAPASTAMQAVIVGSGNFFDAGGATASLTITGCVFQAGDICVVCVADFLSGAATTASSITVGGSGLSSNAGGAGISTNSEIWSRGNLTSGSKSVVVSWSINPTAAAAVVLALRRGKLATSTGDGASSGSGTGPPFDTGATAALTQTGEMAIACVGFNDTDNKAASVFPNGWVSSGRAGTHGGAPGDVCIDVAYQLQLSTSPVEVTGTIATAVELICCVATYLHP